MRWRQVMVDTTTEHHSKRFVQPAPVMWGLVKTVTRITVNSQWELSSGLNHTKTNQNKLYDMNLWLCSSPHLSNFRFNYLQPQNTAVFRKRKKKKERKKEKNKLSNSTAHNLSSAKLQADKIASSWWTYWSIKQLKSQIFPSGVSGDQKQS